MNTRFRWKDVSLRRLINGIERRIIDIPHSLLWYLGNDQAKANWEKLNHFENLHYGKRCFILANGPSLLKENLNVLKDEYTFGLNRIYLLFDKLDFRPTYYISINELVLKQFQQEIRSLDMHKFLNWNLRTLFVGDDQSVFIKTGSSISDRFISNPRLPLSSGGTVTYIALQLAYFMGFTQVVLIGLDHNFSQKGEPNRTEVQTHDEDKNHFSPNYFPKGVKWQLPDLLRSEMAYQLARLEYEKDGRQIFDATHGGHCEVFEKIEFSSLF